MSERPVTRKELRRIFGEGGIKLRISEDGWLTYRGFSGRLVKNEHLADYRVDGDFLLHLPKRRPITITLGSPA